MQVKQYVSPGCSDQLELLPHTIGTVPSTGLLSIYKSGLIQCGLNTALPIHVFQKTPCYFGSAHRLFGEILW